jgi:cold shock CspA family protein
VSRGSIAKVIRSYGSEWGRIRASDGAREVFFNLASMKDPDAFERLRVGEYVDFDEENDRANGTRAVNVVLRARPVAVL